MRTPSCRRIPSQTPSPSTNPLSNTDTFASLRGTSENLSVTPSRMPISTESLRGSAAYACVPACVVAKVRAVVVASFLPSSPRRSITSGFIA